MARHKTPRKRGRNDKSSGAGGATWIWGRHAVTATLVNPERIVRRTLVLDEADDPRAEVVDRQTMAQILPEGAVHQGFAVLAEPLKNAILEDLGALAATRERAAIIVLDQVQDPQNVGAILRTAAALGALGMVIPDRHAPRETGVLAKAASGALETVPIARVTNLARALAILKSAGLWCVGLDAEAPTVLCARTLPERICLVLGAEGRGLRRLTGEQCDLLVRISMAGGVASLNVSAAAAIALHTHASAQF